MPSLNDRNKTTDSDRAEAVITDETTGTQAEVTAAKRLKVDTIFSNNPDPDSDIVYVIDRLKNGTNESMDVNGSSTAQIFQFGPPSGEVYGVERLGIFIYDNGSEWDEFGNLSPLTNGLQLIANIDGTEYEIANLTKNIHIVSLFEGHTGAEREEKGILKGADGHFVGAFRFAKNIVLQGPNDYIGARVRDNLTGLNELIITAEAWRPI